MIFNALEEDLRSATVETLGVISRWGGTMCSDRATRLYLAPFADDVHTRLRLLEDLSYRFLVNGDHDSRIDVIYDFLTDRIHRMSEAAHRRVRDQAE